MKNTGILAGIPWGNLTFNRPPIIHQTVINVQDGMCFMFGCIDFDGALRTDWGNPVSHVPWEVNTSYHLNLLGRPAITMGRAFTMTSYATLGGVNINSPSPICCWDILNDASCLGYQFADATGYLVRPHPRNPFCVYGKYRNP